MNNLGANKHHYSRIRLWGSVGFIITSLLFAPILQSKGISLLPWMILILLICIWINTLFVQDAAHHHDKHVNEPLLKICFKPHVFALLLACFLIQASHGPYYAFFSIYLEGHSYSRSIIGQLWALGVVAEVGVFFWMHHLIPKFGANFLFVIAMALTIIR